MGNQAYLSGLRHPLLRYEEKPAGVPELRHGVRPRNPGARAPGPGCGREEGRRLRPAPEPVIEEIPAAEGEEGEDALIEDAEELGEDGAVEDVVERRTRNLSGAC